MATATLTHPAAQLRRPNAPTSPRTTSSPDVSVCIASWNCRELLRACLRSLLHQEQGVRLEVVVVDNASTDGAAELVEREFPEVVLIRNEANAGFARASNQAAGRATGRYLFFLNNDTELAAGTLGRLYDYAERHPGLGLLAPRLRDGAGQVQRSCRARPTVGALLHRTCLFRWTGLFRRAYRRFRWRGRDLDTTQPVDVVMGAAVLVRRQVFFDCGAWDENYTFGGEDIDLCARVARTHPVVYYPEVEVTHHGRVSSRLHAGWSFTHTLLGVTRFLRTSGTSRPALLGYKAVVTVDAPLQWLGQLVRYGWRRLRGRKRGAARSLLALRGLSHFLRQGLWEFWKI